MSSQLNSAPPTEGARATGRQLELDLTATEPSTIDGLLAADNSIAASLSHELITPLTVIMGALHTFQKHDQVVSEDKRRRLIEMAIESGWELNLVIEALVRRVGEAAQAVEETDHPSRVIRLPLE